MWEWTNYNDELYHHGIPGQKWGVRRWQNADGSLTGAGKLRYNVGTVGKIKANSLESRGTQRKINSEIEKIEKSQKKAALKYGKKADKLKKRAAKNGSSKTLNKAVGFFERGSNYIRSQEMMKMGLSMFTKEDFKNEKRALRLAPDKKTRERTRRAYREGKAYELAFRSGARPSGPMYELSNGGIREITVEELLKK